MQLNEALIRQKQRMDLAFPIEQEDRRARRAAVNSGAVMSMPEAETSAAAAMRVKIEQGIGSGVGKGPDLDVGKLGIDVVIDAVMDVLGGITMEELRRALDVCF